MATGRRGRSVETVVVGAGQAGLVASALLREAGREHVVLDRRPALGGGWQDRWDGFQLVSPNWTVSVPGLAYEGNDPDGFMARDELVAHWRRYADVIHAPVELETDVLALDAISAGSASFRLTTSRGTIDARSVIVAGGPFQRPHVPALANGLDQSIASVHSHHYRRPSDLPPGRVLLIGTGQTGIQLAEELLDAGREVVMSVGRCGPIPRRYRGRDCFWWLRELRTRGRDLGVTLPMPSELPSPAARLACNPQLTGHGGGHDVNLRVMARDARVRLAGRLLALDGTRATFAPDLGESLRFADGTFERRLRPRFDTFAERTGESFPPHQDTTVTFEPAELETLDLAAEGISTVLWTSGYRPTFEWVHVPVFDDLGLPVQPEGRTSADGLTFLGTPYLTDMGSANLVGLVADARDLATSW